LSWDEKMKNEEEEGVKVLLQTTGADD